MIDSIFYSSKRHTPSEALTNLATPLVSKPEDEGYGGGYVHIYDIHDLGFRFSRILGHSDHNYCSYDQGLQKHGGSPTC